MHLRVSIPARAKIAVVDRFSTEEQRRQSSQAQHEYCVEFLSDQGVVQPQVERISDEGWSGELRERPGIIKLREGILSRIWDCILCEDSSRLYRGVALCLELVGLAVDHGIRVICINDFVDTCNEDWQQRLEEAQRHHGQDNFYTRFRIKRAHDSLWRMGAAIGHIRSGYRRNKQNPDDPKSPGFDEIDPKWIQVIIKAFQMVAEKQPLNIVADYLNMKKLPKTPNAHSPEWSEKNVISLIRCTKYRGEEFYRQTVSLTFALFEIDLILEMRAR
ncbi:recombinase family protein, partial [uncultured Rubinisphaera sp.]